MSMFSATPRNIRNDRIEKAVKALYLAMTLILITPVVMILGVLVQKGMPAVSWAFLTTDPTNGMTAGGIFPALLGTVAIVVVALLASVPIGVAAAI